MVKKKVKAIGLLSGGLDSILAVKLLSEAGIDVVAISFSTPFFGPKSAQKAASLLKIPLVVQDITEEHLKIVKHPRYGYGKTMNPCIDCHALMFKSAGRIMEKEGFDFIFSGEVLDERPMSQNKKSLDVVADLSGYGKFILRPLSARLLPPTEAQLRGLINREELLDIRGRSRKKQLELAKQFEIEEFPNPAGGCLLTDAGFCKRLKELFSHKEIPDKRDLELLRTGRHFRLSSTAKLIVGRKEAENNYLEKAFRDGDILIAPENTPGPICLLIGENLNEVLSEALNICAAYNDTLQGEKCALLIDSKSKVEKKEVISEKIYKQNNKRIE